MGFFRYLKMISKDLGSDSKCFKAFSPQSFTIKTDFKVFNRIFVCENLLLESVLGELLF